MVATPWMSKVTALHFGLGPPGRPLVSFVRHGSVHRRAPLRHSFEHSHWALSLTLWWLLWCFLLLPLALVALVSCSCCCCFYLYSTCCFPYVLGQRWTSFCTSLLRWTDSAAAACRPPPTSLPSSRHQCWSWWLDLLQLLVGVIWIAWGFCECCGTYLVTSLVNFDVSIIYLKTSLQILCWFISSFMNSPFHLFVHSLFCLCTCSCSSTDYFFVHHLMLGLTPLCCLYNGLYFVSGHQPTSYCWV